MPVISNPLPVTSNQYWLFFSSGKACLAATKEDFCDLLLPVIVFTSNRNQQQLKATSN
jgi:hypothetical protein